MDFAEHSGLELLKTNHDMVHEGIKQHHCVGTYINSVESGRCAIYRVGDYTMELVYGDDWRIKPQDKPKHKTLYINQLRGVCNIDSSKELKDEVNIKIQRFMDEKNIESYDNSMDELTDKMADVFADDIGDFLF